MNWGLCITKAAINNPPYSNLKVKCIITICFSHFHMRSLIFGRKIIRRGWVVAEHDLEVPRFAYRNVFFVELFIIHSRFCHLHSIWSFVRREHLWTWNNKKVNVTVRRNLYKQLKKRNRLRTVVVSGLLNFRNTMGTYIMEEKTYKIAVVDSSPSRRRILKYN